MSMAQTLRRWASTDVGETDSTGTWWERHTLARIAAMTLARFAEFVVHVVALVFIAIDAIPSMFGDVTLAIAAQFGNPENSENALTIVSSMSTGFLVLVGAGLYLEFAKWLHRKVGALGFFNKGTNS